MPNKKLELLVKILEEEQLHKLAQETAPEGGQEVDQATADRLAKEIFDKLFEAELSKIK